MRIRAVFLLNNRGAVVPFHHQFLIYEKLREWIYDFGQQDSLVHDFCFSGIKGQTKVSKFGLQYFSTRITIVFSSTNDFLIRQLVDKIFAQQQVTIGNLHLSPESVEEELLPEPADKAKYLSISPIVLNMPESGEGHKRFISPETEEFSDLVFEATIKRMGASGKFSHHDLEKFTRFQLVPDRDYLNRLKAEEKKFSRIYPIMTEGAKQEVRAYTFPFELHAAPQVHQFVTKAGLGALTGRGFGMLDFANSNIPVKTLRHPVTSKSQQPVPQFLPK